MKRFGKNGLILLLLGGIAALAVSAGAVAGTKKKSASIQVCVLLPDTKSSVRWTQFDPTYIGAALRKARQEDKATGGKRSAHVKKITFTSATNATVNYILHAAGQVLNSAGTAVLQDGKWKVSVVTFCTLVVLGNGEKPVKGCPS